VRDLAGDVMQDVGLTDSMSRSSADPTRNGAKVAQKSAIQGSEGTTGEGKLGRAVVWKERVRVLEERDEDEPVVNPKVGNKVGAEDLEEAEVVNCGNDTREPKYDADVGDDDLPILVRGEEGRLWHKVVGASGIPLSTGVGGNVHLPTDKEIGRDSDTCTDGRVAKGFPEFLLHVVRNARAVDILLRWVERGKSYLRASLGHPNLIELHMASRGVVLGMGNAPGVVRNTKS
jgi:hypothetical protein